MLSLNHTAPVSPLISLAPLAPLSASAWQDSWLLADRAFDLAEAGALVVGRELAERALALDPCSPDAAHSLVHVFCEERDWIGGGAFLRGWLQGYPTGAPEASHLACHLAQFELWSGRRDAARTVLHERLDARRAPGVRLRDAAAVLWRLHLAGEQGLPWQAARPLAEAVLADPSCPLDATHAALLLAGAGDRDGMARLVKGLRQRGAAGDRTAAEVVLPLVLGIEAFASGRFAEAARLLTLAPSRLLKLEGSNVQRAIFGETAARAGAASALRRGYCRRLVRDVSFQASRQRRLPSSRNPQRGSARNARACRVAKGTDAPIDLVHTVANEKLLSAWAVAGGAAAAPAHRLGRAAQRRDRGRPGLRESARRRRPG